MNHADAALAGHGDGHAGLGHRVHGRRHQRRVQGDILGQAGVHRDVFGQHVRLGGDQQHIVKGEAFLQELLAGIRIYHDFSSLIF